MRLQGKSSHAVLSGTVSRFFKVFFLSQKLGRKNFSSFLGVKGRIKIEVFGFPLIVLNSITEEKRSHAASNLLPFSPSTKMIFRLEKCGKHG